MPDLTRGASALGEGTRQIACARRNIQHLKTRPNCCLSNRKCLPQPVQPGRHQVIHYIVFSRYRMKNLGHLVRLVFFRNLLIAEMGLGHSENP